MLDFLTDGEFQQFRGLIYDSSGITFSDTNRSILESRLKERLRVKQLPNLNEYYKILMQDKEELKELLDSVTTNLTRFFRNMPHFEALKNYVIPELIKMKKATGCRKVTVWSAGCSTGEEPYTIAMVLKKNLPPDFTPEIVASDISLKSLIVAKQGVYDENKIAGVPGEYLSKYFIKTENVYQVSDEIKKLIKFDYHNLKHDSKVTNFDIVFCRNVLIYFDEVAQKEVVERFWRAMADHSFLFIGHSESLFGMQTKFEFLKTDWACLYQKNLTNNK